MLIVFWCSVYIFLDSADLFRIFFYSSNVCMMCTLVIVNYNEMKWRSKETTKCANGIFMQTIWVWAHETIFFPRFSFMEKRNNLNFIYHTTNNMYRVQNWSNRAYFLGQICIQLRSKLLLPPSQTYAYVEIRNTECYHKNWLASLEKLKFWTNWNSRNLHA